MGRVIIPPVTEGLVRLQPVAQRRAESRVRRIDAGEFCLAGIERLRSEAEVIVIGVERATRVFRRIERLVGAGIEVEITRQVAEVEVACRIELEEPHPHSAFFHAVDEPLVGAGRRPPIAPCAGPFRSRFAAHRGGEEDGMRNLQRRAVRSRLFVGSAQRIKAMEQEDALHLLAWMGRQMSRIIGATEAYGLPAGAELREDIVIGGSRKSEGEKIAAARYRRRTQKRIETSSPHRPSRRTRLDAKIEEYTRLSCSMSALRLIPGPSQGCAPASPWNVRQAHGRVRIDPNGVRYHVEKHIFFVRPWPSPL